MSTLLLKYRDILLQLLQMVLFLVAETLRLLDLYKALRDDPRNVTNNGILLKQHAREELTNALNESFPREQPWTEGQVAVKFKNLRSEYVELKWLSSQPGFQEDGVGLSDDWWRDIKRRRHKAHAFKGKLPWVFEDKMKAIVTGYQSKREQQMDEEETNEDNEEQVKELYEDDQETEQVTQQMDEVETADSLRFHHKRKHDDDANRSRVFTRSGSDYDWSLARSVEQSSVAAAGMARGFQDLTAMFQEEAARCRVLEQQVATDDSEAHSLADQRRVLLAIANSLEHSTRATADVAKGYCELVSAFVRETADTERQQRQRESEL
ncbi:hypothetical protein KXD40_000766 [Peronospora effusa]|uniref:Myb/SANT-like domain-containing protein n=2 Tax=Peronospora effusa TaxID=542832 RepID=A0A3M6VV34_9STRA|nr:hypothetical protein DD238_001038 [Peronospora effusa]UIZ20326.1 hypothetical protein KXD40_000766 [Peronospora effusa]CAI5705795.1 unnamed protein product [Peronospora effusa]